MAGTSDSGGRDECSCLLPKAVTNPKDKRERENIHVKRNPNLAEILHPQNRSEDVLRFLVQHQDLPYWGASGSGDLEPRGSLSRSRDGGN